MFGHLVHLSFENKNVNTSRTDLLLRKTGKLLSKDEKATNMRFYVLFCMQSVHAMAEQCIFKSL